MRESEQRVGIIKQQKVWAHCEFQGHNDTIWKGRNEKCEFGEGKCKLIANFTATMVTLLPSVCLSVCLSAAATVHVPRAQYTKRFRAGYNRIWASKPRHYDRRKNKSYYIHVNETGGTILHWLVTIDSTHKVEHQRNLFDRLSNRWPCAFALNLSNE